MGSVGRWLNSARRRLFSCSRPQHERNPAAKVYNRIDLTYTLISFSLFLFVSEWHRKQTVVTAISFD